MRNFKILSEEQAPNPKKKDIVQPTNPNEETNDNKKFMALGNGSIGEFLQSSPMIFNRNGHNMWFGNMYKGATAFLILGGPSFKHILTGYSDVHHAPYVDLLNGPGFVTASVNNAIRSFRTDIWITNDNPHQFIKSAWLDPKIMKFAPLERVEDKIFDNEKWHHMDIATKDCPNMWYFKRNRIFNPETFLFEDSFNWGNSKEFGGKRSVMLIAIKMMYYLGIRKVFLLGCDFNMTATNTYHFEQSRHESSVSGNNATYQALQERFTQLKPYFREVDFAIYNCNEASKLTAFPYVSIDDAISSIDFPDTSNERTEGLYDREYRLKQQAKESKK